MGTDYGDPVERPEHMLYSILLATVDRTRELNQFLRSLSRQTWRDFEVLVIDQNSDDRLEGLVRSYSELIPIRRLRSVRGHSRAFNTGLPQARGEIVAFPDDDCWYSPSLLQRVADLFAAHPNYTGITGREIVEPGFTSGGRWDAYPGRVTRNNIFRRAISFTAFLRRDVAQQYRFDETLGVGAGTQWGAGEETDYLLRLIADGHVIRYDPTVTVWHQGRSGPYTAEIHAKARKYGMGMGRVLRKHHYPVWSVAYHLARPLGGAAQALLTGSPGKAQYHWSVFAGRLDGWGCPLNSTPDPAGEPVEAVRRPQLITNSEDLW
jgi:glycosyltransferase involved in cell wall biosynthesis